MKYVLLFLLLAGSVFASETLYSGNSTVFNGETFTFSLNTGYSSGLPEAVRLYDQLAVKNSSQGLAYALAEVKDALADAKSDDKLVVRTAATSIDVYYSSCGYIEIYKVCFEDSTYYEEDVSPLGDGELEDVVKTATGYAIPFEVTIEEGTSLSASREMDEDSVFIGEEVTVTVTVENEGDTSSPRFTLIENPPIPVTSGKTTLSQGSLPAGESASITYTVIPSAAGKYTFTGTGLSIKNTTLTVKSPVSVTASLNATKQGVASPFLITLANDYTEDLDIIVTVSASDSFAVAPKQAGRKVSSSKYVLDSFELEEDEAVNITGSIFPTEGELVIEVAYGGPRDKPYVVSVPYDVVAEAVVPAAEQEETEEAEEEPAEEPAAENTPVQETPVAETPVEQPAETQTAPAPAEEKRGFVRSFLDFLSNLFS